MYVCAWVIGCACMRACVGVDARAKCGLAHLWPYYPRTLRAAMLPIAAHLTQTYFLILSQKRHDFRKKLRKVKCVV
jgi:hypothetical protein